LEAQTIIKETEPNAEGSDLEHALARYVVIVETYDLEAFITDSVANNRLSLRTTAVRDYNINFLPLLPFIFIIFILPFVKNNKK